MSTQDKFPGEGTDTMSLKRSRMDSMEEIWMLMLSLNRMLRGGEGWCDDGDGDGDDDDDDDDAVDDYDNDDDDRLICQPTSCTPDENTSQARSRTP